jgi:hypothetical protein
MFHTDGGGQGGRRVAEEGMDFWDGGCVFLGKSSRVLSQSRWTWSRKREMS